MTTEGNARLKFASGIGRQQANLRLYAILDFDLCQRMELDLFEVASAWSDAGVALVQYRDKSNGKAEVLRHALRLRRIFDPATCFLLLNDYPDLVVEAGFDGAHIGQGDGDPAAARAAMGEERILGRSTHSADQAARSDPRLIDYAAVGPVFATSTKKDPEPVVGLTGVEAARAATRLPLVAIGGITLSRARDVRDAGADAVAVVSGLLTAGPARRVMDTAQDFLASLK